MTPALAGAHGTVTTRLGDDVRRALVDLPEVARIVVIDGDHPEFVITVRGDWIAEAPAVHHAIRPLRRAGPSPFHYRTIRADWNEPDPYLSTILLDRR
jgi:hypothetical protein